MTDLLSRTSRSLRALALVGLLAGPVAGCGGEDDPAPAGAGGLTAPADFKAEVLKMGTPAAPDLAVHLTWKNITGEKQFVVERKVGTGAFTELGRVEFDMLQYHDDKEIAAGTTYTYRVYGTLADGTKGPHSEATATPTL